MSIYVLSHDTDEYKWINPENQSDYAILNEIDGRPFAKKWEILRARSVGEKPADLLKPFGDFPVFAEPLVSERARVAISKKFPGAAEFLPILVDDVKEFYVLNAQIIEDCLDLQASTIKYFDDGRIMDVRKYVFKKQIDESIGIFRIRGFEKEIMVTDLFRDLVKKEGLKGCELQNVSNLPANPFATLMSKRKRA